MAYWAVGTGEHVIIILHGGPAASHTYLRPEFDELSKVARIIYYDQRGCGLSDTAASYTWQDHVEDLHRVVNQFTHNHEVFLAGSSWGSTLAILYSYRFPYGIKGVILSGTVPWVGIGKKLDQIDWSNRGPNPSKVSESSMTELKKVGTEGIDAEEVETKITRTFMVTNGPPKMETILSLESAPPFEKLERINIPPFLIFKGLKKSSRVPRDWGHIYDAILPKSALITMEHAGHDPWLADPDYVFAKVKRFIVDHR